MTYSLLKALQKISGTYDPKLEQLLEQQQAADKQYSDQLIGSVTQHDQDVVQIMRHNAALETILQEILEQWLETFHAGSQRQEEKRLDVIRRIRELITRMEDE